MLHHMPMPNSQSSFITSGVVCDTRFLKLPIIFEYGPPSPQTAVVSLVTSGLHRTKFGNLGPSSHLHCRSSASCCNNPNTKYRFNRSSAASFEFPRRSTSSVRRERTDMIKPESLLSAANMVSLENVELNRCRTLQNSRIRVKSARFLGHSPPTYTSNRSTPSPCEASCGNTSCPRGELLRCTAIIHNAVLRNSVIPKYSRSCRFSGKDSKSSWR